MTLGRTTTDHRDDTGVAMRILRGLVRRVTVAIAESSIWQLEGFRDVGEAFMAEVFQGVGIWARPATGAPTEAVVVNVGGDADAPIAIALRDMETQSIVADAEPDTTVTYNSVVGVRHLPDGTIEARSHGGTAGRLMTLDDGLAMHAWILEHVYPLVLAAAAAAMPPVIPPPGPPGAPTGTTVLKGE